MWFTITVIISTFIWQSAHCIFELNLYLCEDHNKITISRNVSMVTYIIRSPLTFNLFHYHNKILVALTKCDKYRPYVDYELQE